MKKLREEHENLGDLMFEEYCSGSDSISSSDNVQEARNKWHSVEDVRNRKVCLCCCALKQFIEVQKLQPNNNNNKNSVREETNKINNKKKLKINSIELANFH